MQELNVVLTQYQSREWEDLTTRGFLTAKIENGMALMLEGDGLIVIPADPQHAVCDICTVDEPAAWTYPVKAFVYAPEARVIEGQCSLDSWALCPDCSELVELDMREALLDRAWEGITASLDMPAVNMMEVRNQLAALQAQFWANRCGERTPIGGAK